MSWFNVLKFDTDEDILDLYDELYRKIDAGYKTFRRSTPYPWGSKNQTHSFNGRLSALKQVITDKEYDDEDTFYYAYKQISKLVDYMDDWPHSDSLVNDIDDIVSKFTEAIKRKINFVSGNV